MRINPSHAGTLLFRAVTRIATATTATIKRISPVDMSVSSLGVVFTRFERLRAGSLRASDNGSSAKGTVVERNPRFHDHRMYFRDIYRGKRSCDAGTTAQRC